MQVPGRVFDARHVRRGRDRDVIKAQLQNRLVELFRRDLALRHGLTEIARVGPHVRERLLDFAGRARDGVGHLIPVLGLQLPSTVHLDECEAQALVRVGRSTRHSVDIAESLRKSIEVAHAVGR